MAKGLKYIGGGKGRKVEGDTADADVDEGEDELGDNFVLLE